MRARPLRTAMSVATVFVLGAALVACGGDDSASTTTVATTEAPTTTVEPTTTTEPATTTTEAPATTTEPPPTTTEPPPTTEPPVEPVMALWPAADVVFTTPQAAAEDFLANVFDPGPVLGEFMGGDAQSGEFEVFASAEGVPLEGARSLLIMRQLGEDQGWFVISAINGAMTIEAPEMAAEVAAGPLTVSGVARGFEATVVVEVYVAGTAELLVQEVTMAGNLGVSEPYSVTLDLSGATPGDVVIILVRGGVGLETDPGEFSAMPVLITS